MANQSSTTVEVQDSYSERNLRGIVDKIFMIIAVFTTLFHLYVINFRPLDPWIFRTLHITLGCILGFAYYAFGKKSNKSKVHYLDWLFILLSIGIFVYIYTYLDQLMYRLGVAPTTMDIIVSVIGVVLILELTRRTTGLVLPILALIFMLYAFAGPYLPGIFNHAGYNFERFFTYIFSLNGILGITVDVSSRYLILFITFGAFLTVSGVGNYFIDFARAIAGGLRGGPAKIAIFASALMGTINGSSAGNAVATGSLTIPLMKRVGYHPRFAAATEATASAGGQIMPPIMGAGAFLMAEMTGISYSIIMIAAIIPAVIYFASVYFMVDFEAIKSNLRGLKRSELPSLKQILKQTYLFLPILILLISLLMGFSIIRSGTVAMIACIVVSWLTKENKMGWREIVDGLYKGSKMSIQLISVCACAGIIVGVIALTGIGQRFSNLVLDLAAGSQLIALIMAMLIAIILGMGMPTTAAYAVAATVVAPGLIAMGLDVLPAHMFVFYFAVISAITPPVAVAAFAAAGISGTNPMRTGVTAFRLGIAAFIVPYMFVYSPAILMEGTALEIIISIPTALVGVYFLAGSAQGYFFGYLNWFQRVLLFVGSIVLIKSGLITDIIGITIGIIVFLLGKLFDKSKQSRFGAESKLL